MNENPYRSPADSGNPDARNQILARRRLARIILVAIGTAFAGLAVLLMFSLPPLGIVLGVVAYGLFLAVKCIDLDPESLTEH